MFEKILTALAGIITTLGPMIDPSEYDKLMAQLEEAKKIHAENMAVLAKSSPDNINSIISTVL
jgi:hypothetical protein